MLAVGPEHIMEIPRKPVCFSRLFLIVCLLSSLGFAQDTSNPCQPSPEVAQSLAALPPADDPDLER